MEGNGFTGVRLSFLESHQETAGGWEDTIFLPGKSCPVDDGFEQKALHSLEISML
jgi:hypothetical protein